MIHEYDDVHGNRVIDDDYVDDECDIDVNAMQYAFYA
jgi:hypothetical protein